MTITDRDIHQQIAQALSTSEGDFDIDGMTRAVIDRYGLVHLDEVPSEEFWALAEQYAA